MADTYPQTSTYGAAPTPYTQTLADSLRSPYAPQPGMGAGYTAPNPAATTDIYAPQANYRPVASPIIRGFGGTRRGGAASSSSASHSGTTGHYVEEPARRPGSQGGRTNRQHAVKETIANLLDILNSHGQTDPAALNRQIQGIQRGTEASQGATQEQLAAAGLSGSGVGQAIGAAQGQAGVEGVSQARADEATRAEQRKREDLLLTLQLILNPRIARRGQDKALQAAKYGKGQSNALGGIGSILGGVGSLLGKGGTGGGGTTDSGTSNPDYSNTTAGDPNSGWA